MIIYIASLHNGNRFDCIDDNLKATKLENSVIKSQKNFLESYFFINNEKVISKIREKGSVIFLDSGAFSAYTLKKSIDLKAYCDYIVKNQDIIKKDDGILLASVLDEIGDGDKTYQNQMAMEKQGVQPLPCFHFGEDERFLSWYISNYPYVSLGGLVGGSKSLLILWLDRLWNDYLLDKSGNPRLKIHGFGITAEEILFRYPWHSCDSTTWIKKAIYGEIYLQGYGKLGVSESTKNKFIKNAHIETLPQGYKNFVSQRINSAGFTVKQLSDSIRSRGVFNLTEIKKLNDVLNKNNKEFSYQYDIFENE